MMSGYRKRRIDWLGSPKSVQTHWWEGVLGFLIIVSLIVGIVYKYGPSGTIENYKLDIRTKMGVRMGMAGIVIYRPSSWKHQFVDVQIYRQNHLITLLPAGGRFFYETKPGSIELQSLEESISSSRASLVFTAKADVITFIKVDRTAKFFSRSTTLALANEKGESECRELKWIESKGNSE